MTSVTLTLEEDLIVEFEGEYYEAKDYASRGNFTDPPEPQKFEIEKINIIRGTLHDYTCYVNNHSEIWSLFEELILEEINR